MNVFVEHETAETKRSSPVTGIVQLVRPRHMVKNVFCFAGVVFGPGRVTEAFSWWTAVETFVAFCAASAAVYILNDIVDRRVDGAHPRKRLRPVASGSVSISTALLVGLALTFLTAIVASMLRSGAIVCILLYLLINILYSTKLQHFALIDVSCIALGFVLRLLAGIYALGDLPTTWIVLCTFFLAMFLGFAKRRAEMSAAPGLEGLQQRPVLATYSPNSVDTFLDASGVMTVISYALFSSLSGKNPSLVVTIPIVFYAIMYYRKLVMDGENVEEPETVALTDRTIQLCIILWSVAYFSILWGSVQWFR